MDKEEDYLLQSPIFEVCNFVSKLQLVTVYENVLKPWSLSEIIRAVKVS